MLKKLILLTIIAVYLLESTDFSHLQSITIAKKSNLRPMAWVSSNRAKGEYVSELRKKLLEEAQEGFTAPGQIAKSISSKRFNPYPTETEARLELARRARHPGGELNNTPSALQRPRSKGGDWALYRACVDRFNIPLPGKPQGKYSTKEACRAELKRRRELGLENTAYALKKPKSQGGDITLYRKCTFKYKIKLPRRPNNTPKYPTKQSARAGLAQRKKKGLKNTPSALLKPKSEGGDAPLYKACLNFELELDKEIRKPYNYPTEQLAREELDRRVMLPGGVLNITASALLKSKSKGGDDALYRSCLYFEIPLPKHDHFSQKRLNKLERAVQAYQFKSYAKYPVPESARAELIRRALQPGGEYNNTASALLKPKSGDTGLYKACVDKFNIRLYRRDKVKYHTEKAAYAALEYRKQLGLENTATALKRHISEGGDIILYRVSVNKFKIKLPRKSKYPTEESVQEALAMRHQRPGGEVNNTPSALWRPKSEGGDFALRLACRRFEVSLPKEELSLYPTEPSARTELLRRAHLPGGAANNTAYALDRNQEEGGDRALLRACRRWEIELPVRKRTAWIDPTIFFLKDVDSVQRLTETEARFLWKKALRADTEASHELVERSNPLIIEVIEKELHIRIDDVNRSNAELFDELISYANLIILDRMEEWDCKGSLIEFLKNLLTEELKEVVEAYNKNMFVEELKATREDKNYRFSHQMESLDEIGYREHSSGIARKDTLASHSMLPEESASLVNEEKAFNLNLEKMISDRDTASGLPIISAEQKHKLTLNLRKFIVTSRLLSDFVKDSNRRWALFTIGSLGRLGTAQKGNCDWNALILTDLPEDRGEELLEIIAERLGGVLEVHSRGLPTVIIGRNSDYQEIVKSGDGELSKAFISLLERFGVGSLERDFATVELVIVDGYRDSDEFKKVPVKRADSRALMHTGPEEFSLGVGANATLVAESHKDASKILIEQLIAKVRSLGLVRFAEYRLDVEERFLEKQRNHLENAQNIKEEWAKRPRRGQNILLAISKSA